MSKRVGIEKETVPKLSLKMVVATLESLGTVVVVSLCEVFTQDVNKIKVMILERCRMGWHITSRALRRWEIRIPVRPNPQPNVE